MRRNSSDSQWSYINGYVQCCLTRLEIVGRNELELEEDRWNIIFHIRRRKYCFCYESKRTWQHWQSQNHCVVLVRRFRDGTMGSAVLDRRIYETIVCFICFYSANHSQVMSSSIRSSCTATHIDNYGIFIFMAFIGFIYATLVYANKHCDFLEDLNLELKYYWWCIKYCSNKMWNRNDLILILIPNLNLSRDTAKYISETGIPDKN